MTIFRPVRSLVPLAAALLAFAAGVGVGMGSRGPAAQRVFAATASSDDAFAVCTALVTPTTEGIFILDFETGELTGGVLNPAGKFTIGYRSNVLKDLEFKAGKVKSPKFLLSTGVTGFTGNAANNMAPTALYVTDASTGVTMAYGIPVNGQGVAAFVPLDKARPRGGKAP